MLERSNAARLSISVFYENFNDIDIFVEDTAIGYEKLFATLLSRSAASTLSIDRVFPIGPRARVIQTAREALANNAERKAAYLIDGDLYLLTGEFEDLPLNVVVMPRYCVENFLWDEESFLDLLDEEDCKFSSAELQQRMDYKGWWERAITALQPLFVIFAVAHSLKSGIVTVSRGMKCVCLDAFGEIDAIKSAKLTDEIRSQLDEQFGKDAIDLEIDRIKGNVRNDRCFLSTYVSGKDFLLPLLFLRMRTITNSRSSALNLKMRLCRKTNPSPLADVVRSVFAITNRAN